jgi:AmiR/NasT family two-component response regulator
MLGIAAVMRDVTVRFEETKALRKQLAEAQKRLKTAYKFTEISK